MQDARGVWRRARQHSLIRNRRDPSWRPTSGEGGSYKPMAKGNRAGRESEGFIVLLTPESGGKRKGMVARPDHPLENVRQLRRRLYTMAKCSQGGRVYAIHPVE